MAAELVGHLALFDAGDNLEQMDKWDSSCCTDSQNREVALLYFMRRLVRCHIPALLFSCNTYIQYIHPFSSGQMHFVLPSISCFWHLSLSPPTLLNTGSFCGGSQLL